MRRPMGCGKSRAVESEENQKQVSLASHRPWKSRKTRGIPTFPTAPTAAGFSQTRSGILIVVDRKECLTPDIGHQSVPVRAVRERPQPDWKSIHEQLQQHSHLTLQFLWEEYRQAIPRDCRRSVSLWLGVAQQSLGDLDPLLLKRTVGTKLMRPHVPVACVRGISLPAAASVLGPDFPKYLPQNAKPNLGIFGG
jgi:hypothetical protein